MGGKGGGGRNKDKGQGPAPRCRKGARAICLVFSVFLPKLSLERARHRTLANCCCSFVDASKRIMSTFATVNDIMKGAKRGTGIVDTSLFSGENFLVV